MKVEPETKAQLVRELRLLRARVKKLERPKEKRRHLVEELRESEFKFRSIVQQSADGIAVADEQGSIIEWNPAYERLTGLTRAEALGQPVWEVLFQTSLEEQKTPALLDRFRVSTLDFLKTGQAPWLNRMQEMDIQSPDGTRRSVQAVMFPFKTDKGFQSVSITRDITERKRAEEELQRSEMQYRSLAENSPDLIARFDKQYRHVYVNPTAAKAGRYPPHEYLGKTIAEVGVPEEEARRWEERIRTAFETGQIIDMEDSFETPNGLRNFHTKFVPEFTPDGSICSVQSIARDITERMRTEAGFKQALEWQEAVFEGSRDAVFIADSQGRFVAVDNAACNLTGYTKKELLKMRIPDLHEEEDQAAYDKFRDRIMAGEPILTEARIKRKDGLKVDTEFSNTRVIIAGIPYMHTTARDITGRKQAEEQLRQAKEQYQQLVENINEVIFSLDDGGTITYVSPAISAIGGYIPAELRGRPFSDFILPEDLEIAYGGFQRVRRGELGPSEFRMLTKSGIVRWIRSSSRPIVKQGNVVGISGALTDITERKKAEVALQAAKSRLQQLSRRLLEVQENDRRMLARELHDEIGQILTATKIDLQLLRRSQLPENLAIRLDDNIKSLDGCLQRVRDLSLDLHPFILDDLGLAAALRWQLDQLQERAGFHGHLTAEDIPERFEPDVETACFRVAQEALTNIARHAKAHNVAMSLRLCNEELVLSIQDDGIGFDSDKALAEAVHGKSFGILGMQERVALLGGRLEINSSVGKGTIIGVRLPLRVPPKQERDHQSGGI